MTTVKDIISDAGGVSTVAIAVQLSERSIYKWIAKNAFPRSEYTGESTYIDAIAELCKNFSKEKILEIGIPKKVKAEQLRPDINWAFVRSTKNSNKAPI